MSTLFLRLKSLSQKTTGAPTKEDVIRRVMAHNLREIAAEIGVAADGRIDPARIRNNIVLRGADTSAGVLACVSELMQDVSVSCWRCNTVQALEFVIGLPAGAGVSEKAYFADAVTWIEQYFAVPVVSAVIHLDEEAPHCHIVILPIRDGRLCGDAVKGNRRKIAEMQAAFYDSVARKYGLSKPEPAVKLTSADTVAILGQVAEALTACGLPPERVEILLSAHRKNPLPLALAWGVVLPEKRSKSKPVKGTFAGIMTAPEKGKRISISPTLRVRAKPMQQTRLQPAPASIPIGNEKREFPTDHPQAQSESIPIGNGENVAGLRAEKIAPTSFPIGNTVDNLPQKIHSLSCVGNLVDNYPQHMAESTLQAAANSEVDADYRRIRDGDTAAALWDEERGEFVAQAQRQASGRRESERWVSENLRRCP